MKVLHVIPSISKIYGGPSGAVLDLCERLNQKGVAAEIATTTAMQAADYRYGDGDSAVIRGTRTIFFHRTLGEYKLSFSMKKWLEGNIRNYDLIHIHSIFCYPTVLAGSLARKNKIPYIVRPLGQLYPWSMTRKSALVKWLYMALFELKNIERANAIHFTTTDEMERAVIRNKSRGFVVPNGCNQPEATAPDALERYFSMLSGVKFVLFLGRVHPKKGLELLLSAMASACRPHPEWMFVIAGTGDEPYVASLHRRVNEQGLASRVIFVGHVEGEKKEALLGAARIFVLPSYSENFGIAVAEAMLRGLPVIVSDQVAVQGDIKEYNAGIVVECRSDRIAEALNRLMSDEEMRRLLGENARRLAESRYGWDKIVDRLIKIYGGLR